MISSICARSLRSIYRIVVNVSSYSFSKLYIDIKRYFLSVFLCFITSSYTIDSVHGLFTTSKYSIDCGRSLRPWMLTIVLLNVNVSLCNLDTVPNYL